MTSSSTKGGQPLEFHPVANGVDFLDSAISHLLESNDPRSLKYAVLHMQAATEVLVKVRLQREGVCHIFEDPYSANEDKLRQGKFRSVSLHAALKRLDKVAGVTLPKEDISALDRLNEERNRLQHFGSTSNQEIVSTIASKALDVLLHFVIQHMVPNSPDEEAEQLKVAEELIRKALTRLKTVIDARLERLAPELDDCPGPVITCPECIQMAYILENAKCLFCNQDWSHHDPSDIAAEYAENVLGRLQHLAARARDQWPVYTCPGCDEESLVGEVSIRSVNESTNICFSCFLAVGDDRLTTCLTCGRVMYEQEISVCSDCFEYRVARDD